MSVLRHAGLIFLPAMLLSSSCKWGPLPDLPRLELSGVPDAVRKQIDTAYQAAVADPRNPETNGRLGMVLHAYSQYESAELAYQRARILQPRRFEWIYYLGIVQASNGKGTQAAESFRAAVDLRPDFVPARLRLADVFLSQRQLSQSRKLYEEVNSKTGSQSPHAQYGLGRVLAAQGELGPATEHLRKVCELSPTFGAAHYALAQAYLKSGRAAEAKRHFEMHQNYRQSEPQLEDSVMAAVKELNTSATERLRAADDLEKAGRLEDSRTAYLQALELDPKLSQAHTNLIMVYGKLGHVVEAEKHYRAAVELSPTLAHPHYNFGVLLYGQGRHQEAAAAFRKALELDPNHAESNNNIAVILEKSGRIDDAIRHYQAAIRSQPGYRMAHFHLGRLFLQRGRNDEAISHLRQTINVEDERTPTCLYALAMAYIRSGDRQNGLNYALEAQKRAASLGQQQLVSAITRDIQTLGQRQ